MYFDTLEKLKEYLNYETILSDEELMIFVGDKTYDNVEEMIKFINEKGIKFFGGVYAGLLVGSKIISKGFIVKKLKPVCTTMVLPYIMRFNTNLDSIKNPTAIVLVDGLSSQMKNLTDTIYEKLGTKVKYVGGGAGFYDLQHRPCIFNNNGLHKDVLIVSIIDADIKMGVKHGWKRFQGPFYVTNSEDNILSELDSDNAFDVYRGVIEEAEEISIYKEYFFNVAKDHPFGIAKDGEDDVVRDPIALNEKSEIVCIANVPKNSNVYVLKGDIETLLKSSLEVAKVCGEHHFEKYTPFLFDCISRAMFMDARFEEELENIQKSFKSQVVGALSIGEIATLNNGELVIHNKSTILGVIEEK